METNWKFYTTVDSGWKVMLEACEKAEKTIDLEQFIFIPDDVGNKFLEVFKRKSESGVKIRLLWDAVGSFTFFGSSLVNELKEKGVSIRFFNTVIPSQPHKPHFWFFRNHRRSLIIDSKIAFTGSICVWDDTKKWRETILSLEGAIVEDIKEAFLIMWDKAKRDEDSKKKNWAPAQIKVHDGFSYVLNVPRPGKRFLYHRLIDAIRNSQKLIYLTTPYFSPDRRLIRVLRLASQRGVDVRLILPHSSEHPILDIAAQSFFKVLLSSGIRIFRYKGEMIHSKTTVIDNDWATVGTLNLDQVSLRYNFEANIVSTNRDFIEEVKDQFFSDLAQSEEIIEENWNGRGMAQKILELLVKMVRQFL